ncbi:hypothetical protein FN846DRAFT_889707 [Sphaerosporella brunnea]|uniref:Uncharacterized protein n=1 Tax=Sphaerosporella brunnea TaxID=1250544 RepID=A0A5J5EZ41_9PEZI|nr:hypothetical protein FN846DRAFT_889707 [Sphaerosporella brunnea]
MAAFADVFTEIYQFSSELLLLLNVWDTLSLSLACAAIHSHLSGHPHAFTSLDLRHPAAVAAIRRFEDGRTRRCAQNNTRCRICPKMFTQPSNFPNLLLLSPRLQKLLPSCRTFPGSVLRLYGLCIDRKLLTQVFPYVAPTLAMLGESYLDGCTTENLVDEFLLHRWLRLKVLNVQSTESGFSDPRSRLLAAVKGTGLQLDITGCNGINTGGHATKITHQIWCNCELAALLRVTHNANIVGQLDPLPHVPRTSLSTAEPRLLGIEHARRFLADLI